MTEVDNTSSAPAGGGTPNPEPTTNSASLGGAANEEGIATPGAGGTDSGLVAATKIGDIAAGAASGLDAGEHPPTVVPDGDAAPDGAAT